MTRESKPKRVPTMSDVARLAGVSQPTVSYVINNTPNVTILEETKIRVRKAIQKLGYRRNAMAQSLRSQRSDTIGFITDEIAITPHAGRIIEGAQDAAWKNGKILLLVNTKRQPDLEQTATEMLLERQVEGIIYATMYHHAVELPIALQNVPTVLLDCFVKDYSLPSVVPDEVNGGYSATQTLIQNGHRRIGFINNTDPIPATFGRLEGYKKALLEAKIRFDKQLVFADLSEQGGGYRGALHLMQLAKPPTALFCFNDRVAMGAYDALHKLYLRVPEDVAVIGFDNQEIIAAHLHPPLSTMELPHYKMGAWAVNQLIQMSEDKARAGPVQHKIRCELVKRASI
jgi:LacI family transcriptional regulator